MPATPPGWSGVPGHRQAPSHAPAAPAYDPWQPPWQRWWVVGLVLTGASFALVVLVMGILMATGAPESLAEAGMYAVMGLQSGSILVLVVDGLLARGARRGRRRSQQYFSNPRLRTAVRTGVVVIGGAVFPVVNFVLALAVTFLVVGFLLKAIFGGGGSASGGPGSCGRCNGTGQRTDWHPGAGSFPVRCAWCNGTGSSR